MAPGSGEYGCPYKTYNPDNLQSALLSTYSHQGLKAADLPDIMQLVNANSFHTACTRVFEITHSSCGVKKGDGVNGEHVTHPNQYAAHSRELYKATKGAAESEDVAMGP
jgi:DNA primase large subunit